jgi:diguanylate cyclase (GGDEF)-like protein/PAS domain S-box-containing protein
VLTSAIELIYSLSILVAMSLVSGFIRQRQERPRRHAILQGLLFGTAALIGMMHPLVLGPGLIFDGRSVMISLCGLFFGPLAVSVAAAMALLYRILIGGVGVYMGLLVIAASALWGLFFHHRWRHQALPLNAARLLLVGLVVHVNLLLLMFALPAQTALETLQRLGLPILLTYPLITLLIGKLLSSQEAALDSAVALRDSELRHRLLADNATDVIWTMDLQGRVTYVSPSVEKLRGYSSAEVMRQTLAQALCPASIPLATESLGKSIAAMAAGLPFIEFRGELEQPCKDGGTVWTEVSTSAMRDTEGQFIGILGVTRNITERKKTEAKVRRLSQLYAALSQCNQAIVRCPSETELFPEVCRVAVTFGGMQMAWIGLVDESSRQIHPVASFGDENNYLAGLDLSADASKPSGQGIAGTAIREDRPFWCQDFLHEPRTAPWHESGARAGWAAAAALPLERQGVVVGALLLYAAEVNIFDEDIRKLLLEMTFDISFALDSFAREAARQQSVDRLRQSEQSLKESQRIAGLGSYTLDLSTGRWEGSEMLDRLFGIDQIYEHTVQGWTALIQPDDQAMMEQYFRDEVLGQGQTFNKEYRISRHDDRSQRWVHGLGELEFDAHRQPLKMHGTIQDITERKQAEDLLRVRTDSLNEAQRIAHIGNWTFDLLSSRLLWSDEILRLFELDPTQSTATKEAFLEAIHPLDREAVKRAYTESLTNRTPYEIIHRLLMPDGRIKWVQQRCLSEFDASGKPLRSRGTMQDITEHKKTERQLHSLAFYDTLTGLPNRQLLLDQLKHALATGTGGQRHGALLFIDLDDFRTLNDTRGHETGDMLLQQVAKRLTTCVREGDTVARLSGDEFAVLLEDLHTSTQEAAIQAQTVGEKILVALNRTYQLAHYAHHTTASIGITVIGQPQDSIEEPLKRAELAMYQAKAAGRNTLRVFDPQMQALVTNRADMEAGLRKALVKQQFLLHYQAQVNRQRQITGVEALVRWLDPKRGLVSPSEFIALAEETGLILPLGNWVLQAACKQLALWARRPEMAHLTMAVNVSARQFHQSDFVKQVLDTLERTGAHPHRLKLELTESMLVTNIEDVIAKMNTLKGKGVGFSLDDFGTGYSSLSYLKRLPLDQLKIDQGFVRNILIEPNDAAIAKMVVALANSMGLTAIAEGVETEAQHDLLAGMGCHAYQGYLFSRPLPLAEFETYSQSA